MSGNEWTHGTEGNNPPHPIATPIWEALFEQAEVEIPTLSEEEVAEMLKLKAGEYVKVCCNNSRFHADCDNPHVRNDSIDAHLAANNNLVFVMKDSIVYIVNVGFAVKENIWDCMERSTSFSYTDVPATAGAVGESKHAVVTASANGLKVKYYNTLNEMPKRVVSNRLELLILRQEMQELKESLKFIHDSLFYAPGGPGAEAAKKDYSELCHHTYD
jgi:hypothetical protein